MCQCRQIRAGLVAAVKRGEAVTAAKIAARGVRELANHARRTIVKKTPQPPTRR